MNKKIPKKVSPAVTQIVAPLVRQLPGAPADPAFTEVLQLIQAAKQRAAQAVKTELITLYWQVGEYISRKIETVGWGKGTIQNLGTYLQKAQPGIRGFSPQNIWRMRQFYEAYREKPILSPLVRELPWTHHMIILGRSKMEEAREFYIRLAIREKWGRRELERQFNTSRFERTILNPIKLSPLLRELHPQAAEFFKDIYTLEFLGLPAEHSEADLEGALLKNLGRFITELGRDFCFIGSQYASLGQRPRLQATNNHQALKGRPNPCHNLLPVCTFTSFLAPKIESESFPTGFVIPFTLTWRPCCKTLVVPRCLSIPSRTTFTSSSSWPALLPSVQLSRRSKKPRPSGSRHRARSSPDSRGRQVMVRLRFPNPTCPPSVNTSPGSSNITGRNRFRRNTGRSWSGIGAPSMNGMCGIDAPDWPAPSGLESFNTADPGRCPGLVWGCPVGAQQGATA